MKRHIRIKKPPSLAMACTGGHLPDPPRRVAPKERPLTDETGRPLNFATGSDVDRIVGLDKFGRVVPKGSPTDISDRTPVRHEHDPPDPFGPEGHLVEPQGASEADLIRERYGLDANGHPLPAGLITEAQKEARRLRYVGTSDGDEPGPVRVDYQTDRVQFESGAA